MTSRKLARKLADMTSQNDLVGRHSPSGNVLFFLFKDMLTQLRVDVMKWGHLMNVFIRKQAPYYQNRRDFSSLRGNINKELSKGSMSWKVFSKSLQFLGAVRFRITIDVEYENGKVSNHSCIVSFNPVEPYQPDDSDDADADQEDGEDSAEQTLPSTSISNETREDQAKQVK